MSSAFFETLERRALLSVKSTWSPSFSEAEPNDRRKTAMVLPSAYNGEMRIDGTLPSRSDVDVFRFDAWHSGRVRLSLDQQGRGDATIAVYDANGKRLTGETTTSTQFAAVKGKTYFLQLERDDKDDAAKYRIHFRQSGLEVEASRLATLSKGVNVASWFWNQYGSDDPYDVFANYFTDHDARQLQSVGIRNIRLPVDTSFFVDWRDPSRLNKDALAALDKAIRLLLKRDIAVIVSPFGDYNERVVYPDNDAQILSFVESWAGHLSQFDPERVFLQTANEPAGDPSLWLPMQEKIVATMRRKAPHHTILTATTLRFGANPSDFGTIGALVGSKPLKDPNIVYGFHYYAPYVFTAQGADWAWPGYGNLRYVPYPSTPENVEWLVNELDAEITDPDLRFVIDTVREYGQTGWNAQTLMNQLKQVKRWADKYDVPVMNDEFGAIAGARVNEADRDRWLNDVRRANESLGFGWAMWDYSAGYNLADGDWGNRTLRSDVIEALGL